MYLVAFTASHFISTMVIISLGLVVLKIIQRFPDHYIHYVLRQTWILKRGPNDTYHKPQSTMYGFVVPSLYIDMLAIYFVNMPLLVARIFLCELLLEATIQHSCNPSEVECFFVKNFWDFFKLVEPIDCNHVASRGLAFICLKYKFDINGAFWTAGRVFAICITIIKVLPAGFLFLKQCDAQMYRTLRYPIVLLCLLIIFVLFFSMVRNIASISYFSELVSILFGILLSLTVLFLDFRHPDTNN